MLNEIYEYEQYTTPISEYIEKFGSNKRIIREQIQYGMGIKRALTIIARDYIFSKKIGNSLLDNIDLKAFEYPTDAEDYSQITDLSMQEFNNALHEIKSYLLKWCGRSNHSDLCDSWLKGYCTNILGFSLEDEHYKSLVRVINNNIDYLNMSLTAKPIKNYNDRLCLDNIISNAIDKGPLKRWYLVASNTDRIKSEEDIFKDIFAVTKTTLTKDESEKDYKKVQIGQNENIDNILKITSAYLVNKQYLQRKNNHNNLEYVWITEHDLIMWGVSKVGTKLRHNKYCLNKKKPLFIRLNNDMHDVLITINKKWFDKCGWCLMSETKLDEFLLKEENKNAMYYSDQGSKIVKGNRYLK